MSAKHHNIFTNHVVSRNKASNNFFCSPFNQIRGSEKSNSASECFTFISPECHSRLRFQHTSNLLYTEIMLLSVIRQQQTEDTCTMTDTLISVKSILGFLGSKMIPANYVQFSVTPAKCNSIV